MSGKMRNPCLTMHQPWASLLVYGIKRIEGRSWPAPIRGRLWIHAAGKVPDPGTIKAMEDFYREIYAVNGITDLKFPEHYPVSRLLGCVEIVGCVKCEELVSWEELPEGVRLEGQTDYCWLCEQPQKLLVPFEMRGYQGVYNLEKKIYEAAVRGLSPVKGPLPVKFPLPDPSDRFSLKPGSLALYMTQPIVSEKERPESLNEAIAGARAAAMQFSKKDQSKSSSRYESNSFQKSDVQDIAKTSRLDRVHEEVDNKQQSSIPDGRFWRGSRNNNNVEYDTSTSHEGSSIGHNQGFHRNVTRQTRNNNNVEYDTRTSHEGSSIGHDQVFHRNVTLQTRASSKIFAAAMKGLRSTPGAP